MALPDTFKFVLGTTLVFSNSGEYVPTLGQPSGTDADIDLQNLGTTPDWRESVKLDIGSDNLDVLWRMSVWIEWFSAPDAGGTVDFFLSWSDSVTAGTANTGGAEGVDQAYDGYGAAAADADEASKQLDYIGPLTATADAVLQHDIVGMFEPKARYCCLIVRNATSVALAVTDAIETAVAITPTQHQIQD